MAVAAAVAKAEEEAMDEEGREVGEADHMMVEEGVVMDEEGLVVAVVDKAVLLAKARLLKYHMEDRRQEVVAVVSICEPFLSLHNKHMLTRNSDGQPVPQPDPQITADENALVKVMKGRNFEPFSEGMSFPGRRGYGTKGRPIVLRTNYFKLTERPNDEKTYHKYEVAISGEISKPKKRRLIQAITTHAKFNGVLWASDYDSIIVTVKPLDLGKETWVEKFTLPPVGGNSPAAGQGPTPDFVQEAQARNTYSVKITKKETFSLRHMMDYLRSNSAGALYASHLDIIQLLNIIMCKPPNATPTVTNAGQNRFYAVEGHPRMEKCNLGGGLQAVRGYYSSVRPAVGRLLVNLNVTSGAFYPPMPLLALLDTFRGTLDQQETFIRMLKVEAAYQKDGASQPFMTKNKAIVGYAKEADPVTFRVKRFGNAKEVKFRYTDRNMPNAPEREVTVANYFRQQHGITLKHPERPVLNCGTRADPQYMPVELCTVIRGQPYKRLLTGDQTSVMLKFAARYPNLNAMSIAGTAQSPGNGVRLFRLRDSADLDDPQDTSVRPFGFNVGVDMITVPGRILDTPQVKYGGKQMQPRGGSWNLAGQRFAKPGRHEKWSVLIINHERQKFSTLREAQGEMLGPAGLFDRLDNVLKDYGLTMGGRVGAQTLSLDELTVNNRSFNNRKLEELFGRAQTANIRILLIVLPEYDKWLYARIKFYGDYKFGVHTINAIGQKLQKVNGQEMYMGNLALKFNIKGGGVNHTVPGTLMKPLDNNTMLIGIDVTHPSPGSSEGAPSISAVVASIDEHLAQWPGSVRTQKGREEMVQGLKQMVLERLDLWRRKHNTLPNKIILYRDGVSEGQYELVLKLELPAFREAFTERYGAQPKWPKMAVIIVGKRHHTRFYPTRVQDADYNAQREKGSWNPLPGTIVDRHISGRILREFWLQAHQGLQGTARPAHYVVIKDDLGFEADELEQFTHNMCYLFNRATKAVSICPPAYYADLLCERGRAYLYSTLAENHGSDSSVYDGANSEWTSGVHARIQDSTWYI